MLRSALLVLLLAAAAGCASTPAAPRLPPPAEAPEPQPPPAPPPLPRAGESVWTRDAGARLREDENEAVLPFLFTRLEVLETGEGGALRVRCVPCPTPTEGWIDGAGVVHDADPDSRPSPAGGAGLELAEFLLAVRRAAAHRDVAALREVMSRDFSHQLGPLEPGVLETLAAWEREGYAGLDRLPSLLDRGVAALPGTPIWAAPPEHATTRGYGDLRAGFRRGAEGWEWLFLVRDGR